MLTQYIYVGAEFTTKDETTETLSAFLIFLTPCHCKQACHGINEPLIDYIQGKGFN